MINDFEDYRTWMYLIIDDIYEQIEPLFKRPGPKPACSDSELITMAIIGECQGWDVKTEMLSYWREHRDMFPHIPSQSRFNLIRRTVLQWMDIAQDRQCVIDSLPIPVVQYISYGVLQGIGKPMKLDLVKCFSKERPSLGINFTC